MLEVTTVMLLYCSTQVGISSSSRLLRPEDPLLPASRWLTFASTPPWMAASAKCRRFWQSTPDGRRSTMTWPGQWARLRLMHWCSKMLASKFRYVTGISSGVFFGKTVAKCIFRNLEFLQLRGLFWPWVFKKSLSFHWVFENSSSFDCKIFIFGFFGWKLIRKQHRFVI